MFVFACLFVCVCVCVCMFVFLSVRMCVRVYVCVCVHGVCILRYLEEPTRNKPPWAVATRGMFHLLSKYHLSIVLDTCIFHFLFPRFGSAISPETFTSVRRFACVDFTASSSLSQ